MGHRYGGTKFQVFFLIGTPGKYIYLRENRENQNWQNA